MTAPRGVRFKFSYIIDQDTLDPIDLMQNQEEVTVVVTTEPISSVFDQDTNQKDKTDDTSEEDKFPYSPEELLLRCQQDLLPGVKIFPFRTTRFGGAYIEAQKKGDKIWVKGNLTM